MVEGILVGILSRNFGDMLSGIDREHLSVSMWNGDITLQNVQIKPEYVARFELPVKLTLGKIGKLDVKVPWNQLSSEAVQVKLDGCYIVMEPLLDDENWNYDPAGIIADKTSKIVQHELRRQQKLQSSEEQLKNRGYMERMTAKIIDNLEISISNIHIRVEFPDHSAGIMLENMSVYTTDELWLRSFTDRQKAGQANKDIMKNIDIRNFSFYWERKGSMQGEDEMSTIANMQQAIHEEREFILRPMEAQVHITHNNNLTDFTVPRYNVDIQLPNVEIQYSQQQFKDQVDALEFVAHYQRFCRKERIKLRYKVFRPAERTPANLWLFAIDWTRREVQQRKNRAVNAFEIPSHTLAEYEMAFKLVHRKKKLDQEVTKAELKEYDVVLEAVELDRLCNWTSTVMAVLEKEAAAPKPKTGFFSYFTSTPVAEVKEDYESLFQDQEIEEEVLLVPADYQWLHFRFVIDQGKFMLRKMENGLDMLFSGFMAQVYMRSESFDSQFGIHDASLLLVQDNHETPIIKKWCTSEEFMWKAAVKHKPLNSDADNHIIFRSQSFEIHYTPAIVDMITSFITLDSVNEVLITAAWDTIQNWQDSGSGAMSDALHGSKQIIDLNIVAPTIYLPLREEGARFLVNLGTISCRNEGWTELYESFKFEITQVQFIYITKRNKQIDVVHQLSAEFIISFLKDQIKTAKRRKFNTEFDSDPDVKISGTMPFLHIEFSPLTYKRFLQLSELWIAAGSDHDMIIERSLVNGEVNKQGQTFKSWYTYEAALYQGYIYFYFKNKLYEHFYVKDASLKRHSDIDTAITLANRYGECSLTFTSPEITEKWVKALSETIGEMSSAHSAAVTVAPELGNKQQLAFDFTIQDGKILAMSEIGDPWAGFYCSGLELKFDTRPYDFNLSAEVNSIYLSHISNMQAQEERSARRATTQVAPHMHRAIAREFTEHDGEDEDDQDTAEKIIAKSDTGLGRVTVRSCKIGSPNYQGEALLLNIELGELLFYWNSDFLAALISFLTRDTEKREKQDTTHQVQPENEVLIWNISFSKVDMYLNNVRQDTLLFLASIESGRCNFIMRNSGLYFDGDLGNLSIYDLTDYPHTLEKRSGHKPFAILSVRENTESLLYFNVKIYEFDMMQDDIGSDVKIHLHSWKLVYLQQPIFRLIDFFNYEILGVFDKSMRDAGCFQTKNISYNYVPKASVVSKILSFTNISATIDNPMIHFQPRPSSQEKFILDLGHITIKNWHEWSETDEFPNVWLERYDINMSGMSISNSMMQISEPLDLHLLWDRPIRSTLHYRMAATSQKLDISLCQEDFNLLMTIIDLNVTYDDYCDAKLSVAPKKNPFDNFAGDHGGMYLTFALKFDEINIELMHKRNFADIQFRKFFFEMRKHNDYYMECDMRGDEFAILQEDAENELIIETESGIPTAAQIISGMQICEPLPRCFEEQPAFTFHMKKYPDYTKDIRIDFLQMRIIFTLPIFQQIQNFFYYALPTYGPDLSEGPFDYMKCIDSDPWVAPQMEVNVYITDPIIIFPVSKGTIVLVCQSDILFTWFRQCSINVSEDTASKIKKLSGSDIELYACSIHDLVTQESFESVNKRRLLEPMQFFYDSKCYDHQQKDEYDIGKITMKLSHKDFMLLSMVYEHQQYLIRSKRKLTTSLQAISGFQATSETDSDPISVFYTTDYVSHGVKIVIVNDAAGAYCPVLGVDLSGFQCEQIQGSSCNKIATEINTRISYYNPYSGIWEPLLELCKFQFDYSYSKEGDTETILEIFVSDRHPVNFNFTEIMVDVLYQVYTSWMLSWESFNDPNSDIDSYYLDTASPFSISNETGYSLTISRKDRDQVLEPGQMTVYELNPFDCVSRYQLSTEKLKFTIDGYDSITGIDMNKVQTKSFEVNGVTVVADIQMQHTRKVLTMRSQILLENHTKYDIRIMFENPARRYAITVMPAQNYSIPIDYWDFPIGVIVNSDEDCDFWSMIDLQNFTKQKNGECMEAKSGDTYFIALLQKKKKNTKACSIIFAAPMQVRNALPFSFELIMKNHMRSFVEQFTLNNTETLNVHKSSKTHLISIAVRLPHFNQSEFVFLIDKKGKPAKQITVGDKKHKPMTLFVQTKYEGNIIFTIYAPVILMNNTSLPLDFYYKKRGSLTRVAGTVVDKLLPCNNSKKLCLGFENSRSKSFRIGTVGVKNIIILEETNYFPICQFAYDVQLAMPYPGELIFTQIVTMSPRFVFVNMMNKDVVIQEPQSSYPLLLKKGERSPYHCSNEELVQVRVINEWTWSGPFCINKPETVTVQCQHQSDLDTYFFILSEILIDGSTYFITLSEESEDSCSYKIENFSDLVSMSMYQEGCSAQTRWLDCSSQFPFAWSDAVKEHKLIVEFYRGHLSERVRTRQKYFFNLDTITVDEFFFPIEMGNDVKHNLFWKIFNVGKTKVLRFMDHPTERNQLSKQTKFRFHVIIPNLGISVIENGKNPGELLYISVTHIELLSIDSEMKRKAELAIDDIQIDNQYNLTAIYPVLLSSKKPLARNVINVAFKQFLNTHGCICLKHFEILVQELEFKLESHLIQRLFTVFNRISRMYNKDQMHPIFNRQAYNDIPYWMSAEMNKNETKFYIAHLTLQPIKFGFSFVPIKLQIHDEFETVLSGLGMPLFSIDQAPIRMSSAKLNDTFGSLGVIGQSVSGFYKEQLISEIFTLIGHADFLGNPVGFLNNIGTGFVDLFYEPMNGMVNGPLSAGKGFVKGAGSLLKNTVQGTFGSVSKLTDSVATGLTSLTQDKESLIQRTVDKATNKPRDVVEGVGLGFKSLFKSIGKGITGVVTEPIKGANKKGFSGAVAGTVKGLAGLVIKPVTGVLDVASHTAEGIKNTATRFDKDNEQERVRPPRVLYGTNRILKSYNDHDATVRMFLRGFKKGRLLKEKFVCQAIFKDLRGQDTVIVIFVKTVVLLDMYKQKILWEVSLGKVESLEQHEKGIVIYTSPNKKGQTAFLIPTTDKGLAIKLHRKLCSLLN